MKISSVFLDKNNKVFSLLGVIFLLLAGTLGFSLSVSAQSGHPFHRGGFPPQLNDTTEIPEVLMIGDVVNFTVMYNDTEGDVGDVRVKFEYVNSTRGISDGGYKEMDYNVSGNFTQGVVYWYAIAFDNPGIYKYTFNVTDPDTNITVVENGTEFNVILPVPDEGKIEGSVTTGAGNSTTAVEGADVIIYYDDTETEGTFYYNTTTSLTGYYSSVLPIVEEAYHIYVNATGYVDSALMNFTLETIANETEMDFSLAVYQTPVEEDVTGELCGFVHDDGGIPVEGANVVVKTNAEVQPSTVTNASGYFLIEGIQPGTWDVYITAEGYVNWSGSYNVSVDILDCGSISLITVEPVLYYNVSGNVTPSNTTINIEGYDVVQNLTTGNFTISGLASGTYTIIFSLEGYTTLSKDVVIADADGILTVVLLPEEEIGDNNNSIVIGPILDGNGEPVEGANVSVVINNITYYGITDEFGNATIIVPQEVEPVNGSKVSATKDGMEIEWHYTPYNNDIPVMEEKEEESFADVFCIIVLLIVIVLLVIIFLVEIRLRK